MALHPAWPLARVLSMSNDWILSKHTDDPIWCWRVVNRTTGDWHGFGLTVADAIDLCRRLAA
jgi:hypothetical protein